MPLLTIASLGSVDQFTKVPSLIDSLSRQINALKAGFPDDPEVEGVLLIGSCARGEATHRSDIDLLLILKCGPLNYGRVSAIRERIERHFTAKGESELLSSPLAVSFVAVLPTVFSTEEPEMRAALAEGKILHDPFGTLRRAKAA